MGQPRAFPTVKLPRFGFPSIKYYCIIIIIPIFRSRYILSANCTSATHAIAVGQVRPHAPPVDNSIAIFKFLIVIEEVTPKGLAIVLISRNLRFFYSRFRNGRSKWQCAKNLQTIHF